MAAILRAYGIDFDPDRFCSESPFSPIRIHLKGEQTFPGRSMGQENDVSGMNVVVSEGDFHEFPRQIAEAMEFLSAHKAELSRLRDFPGIESMTLDFGIGRRDVIVQSDYLPPALIRLAGELGIGIELTQYPVDDDDCLEPPTNASS